MSGGDDKKVKLWNLLNPAKNFTIGKHEGYVCSVFFSKSDRYIISGGWEDRILLWDL